MQNAPHLFTADKINVTENANGRIITQDQQECDLIDENPGPNINSNRRDTQPKKYTVDNVPAHQNSAL